MSEVTSMTLTNQTHPDEVAAWCGGTVSVPAGLNFTGGPLAVLVATPDGYTLAWRGDTIIKGELGFRVEWDDSDPQIERYRAEHDEFLLNS